MRGGSQPALLRGEDGRFYVVKFRNNPQHARILANEMIVGRLAQRIGLPAAAAAFIDVPQGLIHHTPELQFDFGGEKQPCEPGLQFGSQYPGEPGETLVVDFLPDRFLRHVQNLESAFLGAFLLDKWTCNCDGRQVVFFRNTNGGAGGYQALLIDHGFCFNDGEWSFPDSPMRCIYPRRLVYETVRGFNSFQPWLGRIEDLSREDLVQSAEGIPEAWRGENPDRLTLLLEQLDVRRKHLRQSVLDARNGGLAPFPNWK